MTRDEMVANIRREERKRLINDLRYYGITLRWTIREIITKLQERDRE